MEVEFGSNGGCILDAYSMKKEGFSCLIVHPEGVARLDNEARDLGVGRNLPIRVVLNFDV